MLGPGLPAEFLEFVKRPGTSGDSTRFDIEERWSTKEELRDAAKAEINTLLVLSKQTQVAFNEFLSGAGVIGKVLSATQVPRGWKISGHDGLLMVPPPREPEFFTKDGRPLFRHPKGTKRVDAREEEVLFSLSEFNEAIEAELFWEQGALWSWDPISFDAALLAPHKPPTILEPAFLEMVKGRSPLSFTYDSFPEFVKAAQLRFHENMWKWLGGAPSDRSHERERESEYRKRLLAVLPQMTTTAPFTACLADEETAPRALLQSLIRRHWAFPPFTRRLLELRALGDAEWATVKSHSARWDLTANMGAGRLYFVRLWHFEKEEPRPVRGPGLDPKFEPQLEGFAYEGEWLDGGDVLLYWVPGYAPMLEGAVHRPRERRREEERRAQDD